MRIGKVHVGLVAAVVTIATSGAACGGSSGGGGSSGSGSGSGSSQPLTLGYTATLSGEFASYGLEMRQGVDLAVSQINAKGGIHGAKITMKVADDSGKPSNGPVVAQRFCDDNSIGAVLGYSFSSVALAAVPVYTQCQLPVVASAVTSPELSGASPYFFRNVLTDAYQGAKMGQYAVKTLGFHRIAVLNQQDDYGVGTSDSFIKAVKGSGGQIVSRDAYQLGTKDFQTQLSRIKGENLDAIYIGGFYAEASKIALQARNLGMSQQLLGTDGSLSPDLIKLGGKAVDGMILYGVFSPSVQQPKVQRFVQDFKTKYGKAPTSWSALAYDAVYAVKAAAGKGGGTSRDQIVSGLRGLQGLPGVTGPTTFTKTGDRVGSIRFITVRNGDFALADKQG